MKAVLRELHPKFSGQDNGYFYLNFKEALEKRWFLTFYRRMQEMDIPVLGMNKLRKFKYNTNAPVFEVMAGRGIDWFDLTIRVSYGDQVVSVTRTPKGDPGQAGFYSYWRMAAWGWCRRNGRRNMGCCCGSGRSGRVGCGCRRCIGRCWRRRVWVAGMRRLRA